MDEFGLMIMKGLVLLSLCGGVLGIGFRALNNSNGNKKD